MLSQVYSLLNDKILDTIKLKAFADDIINVTQRMTSVFNMIRKHCGNQHFSFNNDVFKIFLFQGL